MFSRILHAGTILIAMLIATAVHAQVDGPLPVNHHLSDELTTDDPSDTWVIVTEQDGTLELETLSDDVSAFIGLLDSEDRTINARESMTPPETGPGIRYKKYTVVAGTYYITITTGASGTLPYDLFNTFTAAAYETDAEPNNTAGEAPILGQDNSDTGHLGFCYEGHLSGGNDKYDTSDWWDVETNEDGVLEIGIEVIGNDLVAEIHLYDYELNKIESSYPGSLQGTIHSLDYPVAQGLYYVQIKRPIGNPYDDGYGSYTIYSELAPAAFPVDLEPNNTETEAVILDPDGSATGHLGYCIRGDYDPLFVTYEFDTTDYWKVNLPTQGVLTITTESTEFLETNISIYGENMLSIISSYGDGPTTETAYHIATGTYYVKIARSDNGQYGSYQLTSNFDAAAYDNDPEMNDDWETAAPLSQHGTQTGHLGYCTGGRVDFSNPHQYDTNDYYRIETGSDGLLEVDIQGDDTLDFSFTVYDDEHRGVFSEYCDDSVHATNRYAIAEDIYWLRIHCSDTDNYGGYVVNTTFTPAPLANDPEPNDDDENAYTILFNGSNTGHLGYCTRGRYDAFSSWQYDTTDWWQFSIIQPESLHVVAVATDDTLEVNLTLYDSDLNSLKSAYGYGDSTVISYAGADPGYYFVKASRRSYTKGYGAYTLSVNHTFTPLLPPMNVSAVTQGTTVRLEWDPPPYDGPVSGYNIYRSRNRQFTQPISHESFQTLDELLDTEEEATILIGIAGPLALEFVDPYPVLSGEPYSYWITTVSESGESQSEAVILDTIVFIKSGQPLVFDVAYPYPNPFNPHTTISFALPNPCRVVLEAYTANGQCAERLVDRFMTRGTHQVLFDASGRSSGLYLFRLSADGRTVTRKALLVR